MKTKYPDKHDLFKKEYMEKYFSGMSIMISDELTVVLRAELLIEMLIDIILNKKLVNEKILQDRNFTYFMKIELLYSMGLIRKEFFTIFQSIGEIRNKFAHQIGTSFNGIKDVYDKYISSFEKVNDDVQEIKNKYQDDLKSIFGITIFYLLGSLAGHAFEDA